jgi:hypothetical protein
VTVFRYEGWYFALTALQITALVIYRFLSNGWSNKDFGIACLLILVLIVEMNWVLAHVVAPL